MPFSSLIFLFLFFSITMFAYAYVGSIQKRNKVLIASSLIFYFFGSPMYVPVLVISAGIAWFAGKIIYDKKNFNRTFMVSLGIIAEIFIFVVFKYFNTMLSSDAYIGKYLIPIGISFYILRLISYMIDVYRKEVEPSHHFMDILLYSSIFHLSIVSPIVRFEEFSLSIYKRKTEIPKIGQGINRFTIGLFKVAVLASACDSIARQTFPMDMTMFAKIPSLGLWLGAIAFMVQIYMTFSGYTDMAIGMGKMIGFNYKENFEYPYMAVSVNEFCCKWYMTLSAFIRDYLYLPIKGKQENSVRKIFAWVISAVCIAFWIGRNWNGMGLVIFYMILLYLEKIYINNKLESFSMSVRHLYTLFVIYIGWIIFKFSDIGALALMLKGMIGLNGNGLINFDLIHITITQLLLLIGACIGCTPVIKSLYERIQLKSKKQKILVYLRRVIEIAGPVVLTIVSAIALMSGDYTMFLYF